MKIEFNEIFDLQAMQDAWSLIKQANSFVLLGHKDPDRDTIFSCLAMAEMLFEAGKTDVQIIFPNKPTFKIQKSRATVLFGKHQEVPDLVITFDAAVKQRLYFPEAFDQCKVINVDHHLDNQINGQYNFVDIQACSACEVLARLFFVWAPKLLTAEISQLLLIGILDDSFVFKTQQSGYSAIYTALQLIGAGANFAKAKAIVANHKTPETAKLWASLMAQGQVLANGQLFVMALDAKFCKSGGFDIAGLDGLVNFVANIVDCDVVALLREIIPGEIKGSLRSKKCNVKVLANGFGGGGHKNAAGFNVLSSLPAIITQLEAAFKS